MHSSLIDSEADFMSVANEPEFSNGEMSSTGKPMKATSAAAAGRTLQKRRPRTRYVLPE